MKNLVKLCEKILSKWTFRPFIDINKHPYGYIQNKNHERIGILFYMHAPTLFYNPAKLQFPKGAQALLAFGKILFCNQITLKCQYQGCNQT